MADAAGGRVAEIRDETLEATCADLRRSDATHGAWREGMNFVAREAASADLGVASAANPTSRLEQVDVAREAARAYLRVASVAD